MLSYLQFKDEVVLPETEQNTNISKCNKCVGLTLLWVKILKSTTDNKLTILLEHKFHKYLFQQVTGWEPNSLSITHPHPHIYETCIVY